MKKLILFTCVAFMLVAFNVGPPKKSASPTNQISLNGIPEGLARDMISQFASIQAKDSSPLPESVWIGKEEFHDIVTLLVKEKADDEARKDPTDTSKENVTDGMRIYFACDTSATNPHNSTSIILVATKDDGASHEDQAVCSSGRQHLDNYTHSATAPLFMLNNISGEICTKGASCIGDSLYIKSVHPSVSTCHDFPHSISRDLAERMVGSFNGHSITTTSEWFDLCYLRNIDRTQDGVRIYFATRDPNQRPELSSRDAFIIVPTKYSSKYNAYLDDFTCPDKYYYCSIPISLGGGGDNGELCPANCKQ